MSLFSPQDGWYDKKVSKDEKMWMLIALVLCIIMFIWMIMWHVYGKQNPSNITYKTSTKEFAKLSEAYLQQNMVGTEEGIPIVKPKPNSDVFVLAEMWRWSPVLLLEKNQSYKLHISSKDVMHGFSIQPINMNFQVFPDYDYVLEFKPTEVGEYKVICNEFCGIGHHAMIGKIIVYENDADLAKYGYTDLKEPAGPKAKKSNVPLTEDELIMMGEQVFTLKGCGACHRQDGNNELAPSWINLYGKTEQVIENGKLVTVTVDEEYIKESILDPMKKITVGYENRVMPAVPMTDEDLEYIIAYIKSLKK